MERMVCIKNELNDDILKVGKSYAIVSEEKLGNGRIGVYYIKRRYKYKGIDSYSTGFTYKDNFKAK